ncbi:hypothetical protein BpHYR1_038871 [Brachionus plicatilis]|uniref:Uncharacterized protein n=1 Tax=Brachionus plicatilis TaxID=10195 RepID=A0A3M7R601_BRAPC|nr:hypothetical protein BpHYR1_038871 [Brachionus plicatilis]
MIAIIGFNTIKRDKPRKLKKLKFFSGFLQIYGVNAHENNHVFFDVLFNVFCFSSKLLNEINETDSSFFTPGTKRKAERTYSSSSDSEAIETIILILINNKPVRNRLRKDLLKLVPKNSNFKKSWKKAGDSFKNDKNKKK